jgi:CheY-like chemotaxis protein
MTLILLVEDNELNRDALSRRLQRRGYDVRVAEDGPSGLRSAREQAPDLILLDLGLPEMDGWEVTRRLREGELTRAIPIIALTAHALPGDRERTLAAGVDDFDTKPVDFARLLEKIQRQVARGEAGR